MKLTLLSEKDLNKIAGKFIVQINSDQPDLELTDGKIDLEFYLVKRVRFVCFGGKGVIESDLFGNTITIEKERYIEIFNNYYETSKDKRFHRLLYHRELDKVFQYMKSVNY